MDFGGSYTSSLAFVVVHCFQHKRSGAGRPKCCRATSFSRQPMARFVESSKRFLLKKPLRGLHYVFNINSPKILWFFARKYQEHLVRNFRRTRLQKWIFPSRVFDELPARNFREIPARFCGKLSFLAFGTTLQNPWVFFWVFLKAILFCHFAFYKKFNFHLNIKII